MDDSKDPYELGGKIEPIDRSKTRIQILSLSGGGYRGLFAACVLAELIKAEQRNIVECFDVIAGTSIGGIMAIGLAVGKSPEDIKKLLLNHGKEIFPSKFMKTTQSFVNSLYSPAPLEHAIKTALGDDIAQKRMKDIKRPLCIVSISRTGARPHFFQSGAFNHEASDVTLLDAAMATSAAPTFFPSHKIGEDYYIDGGLIANAPDLAVMLQIQKVLKLPLESMSMLSIGTAAPSAAATGAPPQGGYKWFNEGDLVNLTMEAQQTLAIDQARRLLAESRYIRIDRTPGSKIAHILPMDAATEEATTALKALATEATYHIRRDQGRHLADFFAHKRHLAC